MFTSVDISQAVIKGKREDPSTIHIGRLVKNNRRRIHDRVLATSRRLPSTHIFIKLLGMLGLNGGMTYDDVEWLCERNVTRIANTLGTHGPGNFGSSFLGEFLEGQDELISLVARPINPNYKISAIVPAQYIYHPYTSINWEMDSCSYGNAFSAIEINLVALAWQFVQYLNLNPETRHNIPRWLHDNAYYPMLSSFYNISLFNRHYRYAQGLPKDKVVSTREYSVPELEDDVDSHVANIASYIASGNYTPAAMLNQIPLFFDGKEYEHETAMDLPSTEKYPVATYQHRSFYMLADLYYLHFVLLHKGEAVKPFLPTVKRKLRAFKDLRIVDKMPSHLSNHIKSNLIYKIEKLL